MSKIVNLYKSIYGHEPARVEPITGSGSNRRYFRLIDTDGCSVIGVVGESVAENEAFIYLAGKFAEHDINVPRVLAVSADATAYLQTDLGHRSLFDAIASGRASGVFSADEIALLESTIAALPDIQFGAGATIDFSRCYPQPELDRRSVFWDLNYFKYCFLRPSGVSYDESCLEDDFEHLADELLSGSLQAFMYRDFQSRNVMLDAEGNPAFIDFQGGRRGPALYDVASFLWQAKAGFPQPLRHHLIEVYAESARRYVEIDAQSLTDRLATIVLFRLVQVLGAYGFRGLFERKAHFIESIPPALKNVASLLDTHDFSRFPALVSALKGIIEAHGAERPKRTTLRVSVISFSYKQGLPTDPSGNGGGFIFDCRGMHNPGRYDQYKPLTGRDLPVISFLEEQGEIQPFLEHCYALVDASVEVYLRRGFTDLMVAFGCTGGRHRSLYCADHMAAHLSEKFGVEVLLTHREQNITELIPSKATIK